MGVPEVARLPETRSPQNIRCANMPETGYKNVLIKAGLHEAIAPLLPGSGTGISKGGLIGTSTMSLSATLKR
jgi:hypothetical protein